MKVMRLVAAMVVALPSLAIAQATAPAGHTMSGGDHAAHMAKGQPANGPDVGQPAPDFTISVIGQAGAAKSVKLADFRGQTVVLAFFPRVRTSGCTTQMQSYRDKYRELFAAGNKVTLLAISTDPSEAQQAWAKDENFPMWFGSDADGTVGAMYGAYDAAAKYDKRYLYVIGPDGKVTYTAKPFRQMVETAYSELGDAVAKARGAK
ncbi:MAG: redoxin domain-containing protein [Gemmatimonadaceae bacterium]|jgi:peroxiredoxin Q/BCP|nr:redoxin domain-containing protein [Gemmatimonadaceae bacterium]